MKKVVRFKDFEITNETTYKLDASGNMVEQKWAMYKDWYPEKYGEFKDMDISFVWVITESDIKKGIFSGDMEENIIRNIVEDLKNNDSEDENEKPTENKSIDNDMSMGEMGGSEGRSDNTD